MQLIVPDLAHLEGYTDALRRGWSPDNVRVDEAPREELARIEADPTGFVASLDDPEAKAGPVTLPDGTMVPRMPGYRRWMWDGEFCGSIGFRWQPGTAALPSYVLGHIGYAVAPWKRRRGYATLALGMLLKEVRQHGLPHVDLTTDPDNLPSQKGHHRQWRRPRRALCQGRRARRDRGVAVPHPSLSIGRLRAGRDAPRCQPSPQGQRGPGPSGPSRNRGARSLLRAPR